MLNLPTLYYFLYPYTRFLWLTVVLLFFPISMFSHTDETLAPTQIYIGGSIGSTSSPIRVFENLAVGTLVGRLTTDNPTNPTSTHSYTFIAGFNDNHRYYIIGDQLFTAEIFDFEQVASHMIQIFSPSILELYLTFDFSKFRINRRGLFKRLQTDNYF